MSIETENIILRKPGAIKNDTLVKRYKLGELADVVRGSSPRPQGDPRYYGGSVPRLMVADLTRDGMYVTPQIDFLTEEGAELSRPMKKDDVVIAVSGNPGLPSILKSDACIHDGFVGLRNLNSIKILNEYLYYFLLFNKLETKSKAVGAIFKNLTTDQIKKIDIPLPDLKTQKKITQVLEQADKARQQRKAANALTDQFLQSSFLSLFGDPVKNEKGWEMKKIGEFTLKILSGKSVQSESRLKEEDEYGVLKVSAVTYGIFKPEEHKAIINGFKPDVSITPKKGDILFSRANTKELVAATCIVDKDYPDLFLPDKLWKVNIDRAIVNEWFFKYVLSQQSYRNKLSEKSTGTSGSMFNISKEKLIDFNFLVPPLSLQQQFAGIVAQAEQLRQKQRESELELETLFQSLLQKYFG